MGLGRFERYDLLGEELLVLLVRAIFCWFLFFVGIGKNSLIWYKLYICRMSYVGNVEVIIVLWPRLKTYPQKAADLW